MGDFSDYERCQLVGAPSAGASVTKTAILLGVSRATVSKIMSSAYMNRGKTSSTKRNSGRKSSLTERDRHTLKMIVLKNHTNTAAQNNHLEDPVSTKTVQHELHKTNIHGRAAVAKPLITESNT
jgi:transposase